MRVLLTGALLLLFGPQVGRPAPPARPAFWEDPRFRAEVRLRNPRVPREHPPLRVLSGPAALTAGEPVRALDAGVQWAQDVADACAQAAGAPVVIQALWGRERVLLPAVAGEARQVMLDLQGSFGGRWWKTGRTWVLARTLEEVRLTLLTREERLKETRAAYTQAFRSLQRADWERLLPGEAVPMGDLSPGVRAGLHRATVLNAFERIEDPSERAAGIGERTLRGVLTVRFSGSGQSASLAVRGPGWSGSIPFYHPTSGQLMWGVPPPR